MAVVSECLSGCGDYPNTVVYDEVAPPHRLVYTHLDPRFQTTVTFDEMMGMTALTMRLVFATAAERHRAVEQYHAEVGANQTLDRLGRVFTPIPDSP
ncbi:MAG TPA: SRPBCC domain-containing protein [Candidatus Dormibacteraeota bacterium]|nr:SRPBCC domain-containing protein [Candidatus Dormibacteraeota bacterium]